MPPMVAGAPKAPEARVLSQKPYSILVRLPGRPASPNELLRSGIWRASSNAKHWKILVRWLVACQTPPEPLKSATIRVRRFAPRSLDWDGLVGSLKPIIDGLCEHRVRGYVSARGVLSNDSYSVTGKWDVDQEYHPGEAFFEVLVTEAEPRAPWRGGKR